MILIAWMMGRDLDFDLGGYEALTMMMAAIGAAIILREEEATWLSGVALVSVYGLMAMGFVVIKDQSFSS